MPRRNDPHALDALLDALGTARRRYVLYYVREHGESDVADLTATVTDWQAARSDDGDGGELMRTRVRSSLHHFDLPKLSEAGLVSVDRESNTVSYEGTSAEDGFLDVLRERERLTDPPAQSGDTLYRGV